MKRARDLFEKIVEWDNLRLAVARALRGKRHRPAAQRLVSQLDAQLAEIREQLRAGTFPLGEFHQFVIHDPKERVITAPCFRERVVHHAIINVCEPVFERWLIDDTFACRRGRGRIAAIERAGRFARQYAFFLKLDIRKYFDSVSHRHLEQRLERLFKDPHLLDLFARILEVYRGRLGRGLPIGSLTSQHFANFYLGWADRFIKERCRVRGYVRYMDDMVLWSQSKKHLRDVRDRLLEFLQVELALEAKECPFLNRTALGVNFLGCRVLPGRVTLNRRSRLRFRRRLRRLETDYAAGKIDENELQQRGTSLVAFACAGNVSSWQFRRAVLENLAVSGHKARTG